MALATKISLEELEAAAYEYNKVNEQASDRRRPLLEDLKLR